MKNLALVIAGMLMLAGSTAAMSATKEITATFSPSMANPQNNSFKNTTPQSGYCRDVPSQCVNTFSIDMGGITASLSTSGFKANSTARMGMFFKMPGAWRNVNVTHQGTGARSTVRLRFSAFSARYLTRTIWNMTTHQAAWSGTSFVNPPLPCVYSGMGFLGARHYRFMWKWPANNAACVKTAKRDLTGEPYLIDTTSVGYELITPEPLKMESGIYTGTLSLRVGPGGEIDFGDNMRASDTELRINLSLSVNHELKLTTTASDQRVALQPCASGRICSEGEGSYNWERWMVTRITPEMTGRSQFRLSSSGAFTVYLQCEQQSGPDCALKSDNTPSQRVPVKAFLSLPDNIVDNSTASTVSKRRLTVGRELTKNVFMTKVFGQNKTGSIDFLVGQKDVDTMLKTRPDTYRGAITVIFDPKIF